LGDRGASGAIWDAPIQKFPQPKTNTKEKKGSKRRGKKRGHLVNFQRLRRGNDESSSTVGKKKRETSPKRKKTRGEGRSLPNLGARDKQTMLVLEGEAQ